jgi:hypothetical protein
VPEFTVLVEVTAAVKVTLLLGDEANEGLLLELSVVVVEGAFTTVSASDHPEIDTGVFV